MFIGVVLCPPRSAADVSEKSFHEKSSYIRQRVKVVVGGSPVQVREWVQVVHEFSRSSLVTSLLPHQ
jgi:hypothetical protein